MAKKRSPYEESAANQALLRFSPEESVLAALLREAEDRRSTGLRQAKSSRQRSVGAVDQALPQVEKAYTGAQAAITPQFVNAGGTEASALQARMGEALAMARTQLQNRRVGAIEGEGAARSQVQRDYASDRDKVLARAGDLGREKGAFTTETIGELQGADDAAQAKAEADALDREATRGNAWIGAGVDPGTGQPIPGGRLDPKAKAKSWAPQGEQTKAYETVQSALTYAKTFKKGGVKRGKAAQALLMGAEEETEDLFDPDTKQPQIWKPDEIDPATGKAVSPDLVGTKKKRVIADALPKIENQLYLAAALDMAYDGHLSRKTQKLLHENKIKLKPLGLVTFGEWLKTPDGQKWKRRQVAQSYNDRIRSGSAAGPIAPRRG